MSLWLRLKFVFVFCGNLYEHCDHRHFHLYRRYDVENRVGSNRKAIKDETVNGENMHIIICWDTVVNFYDWKIL